jgi:hypothetical protein
MPSFDAFAHRRNGQGTIFSMRSIALRPASVSCFFDAVMSPNASARSFSSGVSEAMAMRTPDGSYSVHARLNCASRSRTSVSSLL